jgi:predicted site-specific integrase-resolvase
MSDVGHRPRQQRNANNSIEPVYNGGDDDGTIWLRCPEAARRLRVSSKTLGRWAARGWIRSVALPGGGPRIHRLYDVATIVRPATDEAATNDGERQNPSRNGDNGRSGGNVSSAENERNGIVVIKPASTETGRGVSGDTTINRRRDVVYARVSTAKQAAALDRQIARLRERHPGVERVFSDVASGLNFRRRGLCALLDAAFAGRVRTVYIAHRDRLCRFAYDCLEFVLGRCGAHIVVDAPALDSAAAPEDGDDGTHRGDRERELADDLLAVVTVFGARVYGSRGGGGNGRRKRPREAPEEGNNTDREPADAISGDRRTPRRRRRNVVARVPSAAAPVDAGTDEGVAHVVRGAALGI